MNNNITIRCNITTTDPRADLGVRILLDQQLVYETAHVKEPLDLTHEVSDDDGEHEFIIELFGKRPEHTTIDSDGNIITDALLTVNNLEFDGIDILNTYTVVPEYHHDFNGSGDPVVVKFFQDLGCNGQVRFRFTTPFYIWLLENM